MTRFQEFIGKPVLALTTAIDRARPRWTYAKGPKSRADLIAAERPVKVKLRAEPLRFSLSPLFSGAGERPRQVRAMGLEASAAPDPVKLFSETPSGPAAGKGPRYQQIRADLLAERDSLEGSAHDAHGGKLASALISRLIAGSADAYALFATLGAFIGLCVFTAGLLYARINNIAYGPFGYGAVYFLAAFIVSGSIWFLADWSRRSAEGEWTKASDELIGHVRATTGDLHDKLTDLRNRMQSGAGGGAIEAATQARLATIAGMRFFHATPVVGAEAGHKCTVFERSLRQTASGALGGNLILGALLAALSAGALGMAAVVAQQTSGASALDFLLQPVLRLIEVEKREPGRVSLLIGVGLLVLSPLVFAPLFARLGAAMGPRRILASEPARRLADELRNAALAEAAEKEQEMIERYAEALFALEARAKSASGGGTAHHTAASNDDAHGAFNAGGTPAWRRGPEAPRFVSMGFQSTPPTFVAGAPKASLLKNLFGGPRPKRG